MAEIRIQPAESSPTPPEPAGDPSLAALVRQLADDGRTLIQQELTLAKAEVQQNVVSFARNAAVMAAGGMLLVLGLLILLVFLILGLGRLLGGQYWLSTLIVGALFAVAGGVTILVGRRGLRKDELKPTRTAQSLRESTEWAKAEAQQLKRDLAT
jgi:hypothetical protein